MGRNIVGTVLVALLAVSASGCSIVLTAHQPSRKDTDVLRPGVARNLVLAELGAPIASDVTNGKRVELFRFVQGYRTKVRVGRVITHAGLDVLTQWLWELPGTVIELVMHGTRLAYELTFDSDDKIDTVVQLRPQPRSVYYPRVEIHAHVPKIGKTPSHWLLEGLLIRLFVDLNAAV